MLTVKLSLDLRTWLKTPFNYTQKLFRSCFLRVNILNTTLYINGCTLVKKKKYKQQPTLLTLISRVFFFLNLIIVHQFWRNKQPIQLLLRGMLLHVVYLDYLRYNTQALECSRQLVLRASAACDSVHKANNSMFPPHSDLPTARMSTLDIFYQYDIIRDGHIHNL